MRVALLAMFLVCASVRAEGVPCDESYTKSVFSENGSLAYMETVTYAVLEDTDDPSRTNHYLVTACDCAGTACPYSTNECAPPYTCTVAGVPLPEPACYHGVPYFYPGIGVAIRCSYRVDYPSGNHTELTWGEVYATKM